ncbi:RNA-binding cell elongation regulator Jag/EloR, partial [Chloroflexota bacterium]
SGFLGLGSEEATVRVTPLSQDIDENINETKVATVSVTPISQVIDENINETKVATLAKEVLEELLRLMRLNATVKINPSISEEAVSDRESIALEVSGDDLGVLIGRRGETLASLQYVVRIIMAHHQQMKVPLTVDVESYKQRRYKALRDLALNLAQKAKATGQAMTLEPMPADERRIVHLALSVNPEVTTLSDGEGEVRRVIIQPRRR